MATFDGPFNQAITLRLTPDMGWFLLVDADQEKQWATIEPLDETKVFFSQRPAGAGAPESDTGHEIPGRNEYGVTTQQEFVGGGEHSCWIRANQPTDVTVTVV